MERNENGIGNVLGDQTKICLQQEKVSDDLYTKYLIEDFRLTDD